MSNVQAQSDNTLKLVSRSVVFIYDSNTQPCEPPASGKILLPLGSGFIAGIQEKKDSQPTGRNWKFLVTAQHVIGNRDSVILRLNKKGDPGLVCHKLDLSRSGNTQNVFAHKRREVDLLLINMPDIPDTDPIMFDYSLMADDDIYKSWEVQEGTDVYTVGYLYSYSGQKQNFPVTKFGKVALLTEENWYRSPQPRDIDEQAYLIELNNTPGLSGAPVILKSPQFRINDAGQFQFRKLQPMVIGVIKGLLLSPTGSQGLAAIEPARHLKEMLRDIARELRKAGLKPDIPE